MVSHFFLPDRLNLHAISHLFCLTYSDSIQLGSSGLFVRLSRANKGV
jgi:hypothetical protein